MNTKNLKSLHFKKPLLYCVQENENQQNYNQIIFEKLGVECEKYIFNLKTKTQKLIFTKRKITLLFLAF